MYSPPRSIMLVALMLVCVCPLVFLYFDLTQPLGVAAGFMHILTVIFALMLRSKRMLLGFTVLGVALIAVGYFYSSSTATSSEFAVLMNRGMSIVLLLVVGSLSYSYLSAQLQLEDSLQKLAELDPLTSMPNRRALYKQMELVHKSTQNSEDAWALLFVEIDDFSNLTQLYGYRAGDEVIKEFARCCQNNLRRGDYIARYSSDVFAIVCPFTDASAARSLSEKLRQSAANMSMPPGMDNITVSVGYGSSNGLELNSMTVLTQTEQALYCAKNTGKNCVRSIAALKFL